MRRLALLLPLLLAACHKEPSFDERYDKAANEIEERAKAMDADIAESEKAVEASDLSEPEKPANPPASSGE